VVLMPPPFGEWFPALLLLWATRLKPLRKRPFWLFSSAA
jgi:hypothetical protein